MGWQSVSHFCAEPKPDLPLLYALGADAQLLRERPGLDQLVRTPKVQQSLARLSELTHRAARRMIATVRVH